MDGYARSYDEVYLYIMLRPCDCGEIELDSEHRLSRQDGTWVQEYSGYCPRCGRERSFRFRMPDELPPMGFPRFGPDDEPSQLLDPGEWLVVADGYEERAAETHDRTRAREFLASAAAATDEVLKFVPDGADEVPVSALWRDSSLELYLSARHRFRASDLADHRATLLAEGAPE